MSQYTKERNYSAFCVIEASIHLGVPYTDVPSPIARILLPKLQPKTSCSTEVYASGIKLGKLICYVVVPFACLTQTTLGSHNVPYSIASVWVTSTWRREHRSFISIMNSTLGRNDHVHQTTGRQCQVKSPKAVLFLKLGYSLFLTTRASVCC